MSLFGISKRKAEKEKAKLLAEEEAKKEREIQTKIRIRKTLNGMKIQSKKLDVFKKEYVEKAQAALKSKNNSTYNLAKQGIKLCLSKQRFLDSMVANFEIALQMSEMNKVINEFVNGMNLIAEELKGVTSSIDIVKAQAAYDKALANNEGQYEALDAFLKEAESSIESFNGNDVNVSDEEIEELINSKNSDFDAKLDEEINRTLSEIQRSVEG